MGFASFFVSALTRSWATGLKFYGLQRYSLKISFGQGGPEPSFAAKRSASAREPKATRVGTATAIFIISHVWSGSRTARSGINAAFAFLFLPLRAPFKLVRKGNGVVGPGNVSRLGLDCTPPSSAERKDQSGWTRVMLLLLLSSSAQAWGWVSLSPLGEEQTEQ